MPDSVIYFIHQYLLSKNVCVLICRKDQESIPAHPSFGTKISPEEQDSNLDVLLARQDLWQKFNQIGTEMLVTKSGR